MKFIEKIKFNKNGLIPVIIQDIADNKVLMLAYMNKKAIERTLKIGKTCFWSRSRKKYWVKGEESANFQIVKTIHLDCDGDTLLIKVKLQGLSAACHEGYRSCFFRQVGLKSGKLKISEKKIFDPNKVYKK